jgi:hypothetical protein
MVKLVLWLLARKLPPQQRIDRAMADIDTRIARVERRLLVRRPAKQGELA